jgi:hypothetical protein
MWFLWGTNWISLEFCSGDVMWFLWGTNWISLSFCSGDVMWFLWGTNWISLSFYSGDDMWFLWGTDCIYMFRMVLTINRDCLPISHLLLTDKPLMQFFGRPSSYWASACSLRKLCTAMWIQPFIIYSCSIQCNNPRRKTTLSSCGLLVITLHHASHIDNASIHVLLAILTSC